MSRRQAREIALQSLFQLDFNECEVDSAIENVLSHKKLHEADCDFVRILVSGTRENLESIDKMIAEKSKDWKIERMSAIDRNIVRLAIFEMKFSSDKLVPNIAINEAVELAKKFGVFPLWLRSKRRDPVPPTLPWASRCSRSCGLLCRWCWAPYSSSCIALRIPSSWAGAWVPMRWAQ